jgi:tetratricopeptide (TPR) repeat protein
MLDNLELYLATAALNNKKYQVAAELYMKVAARNDSAEAWVGMGLIQLYQLATGRTMDEVIFCFDKAKSISPNLQRAIEAKLIGSCQILLNAYVTFFNEALKQQIHENKKLTTALLLTGNNLQGLQSHCNEFSSFAGLGIEGAGVAPFKKALNMDKLQKEILIRFHEIENALRKNVDQNSKAFGVFAQLEITVLKIEAVQKQERIKNKSIKSVVAKKVLVASQR